MKPVTDMTSSVTHAAAALADYWPCARLVESTHTTYCLLLFWILDDENGE